MTDKQLIKRLELIAQDYDDSNYVSGACALAALRLRELTGRERPKRRWMRRIR